MKSQLPNMTRKKVLIAGGGISGMAAALALAQSGWQTSVLERASAFSEVGAGIQLGPNVTRVLQGWGLGPQLQAVAAFPPELQVRCAQGGRLLGRLPLGERAMRLYGAPYATVHRADCHALLASAAQEAGAQIHAGQALERWESDDAGVRAFTAQAEHEAQALIGADGLWSVVRQTLLADGPPQPIGHLAWRAMLNQADLPAALRSSCVTLWLGERMHAVQYPVRRGEWLNLVVITQDAQAEQAREPGWDLQANAYDLLAQTGAVCAPLRELLEAAGQASVNPYAWRLWQLCVRPPVQSAGQMAQGRVTLLGDAAHPMPPYLAQGAGMAIEDAQALGSCLKDEQALPQQLARYAERRWMRCARVQKRALRNAEIFHASGFMLWGRNMAMRLLGERLLDMPWLYSYGV